MSAGRHYRFRKLEFWAERGLINIVDERFPPDNPKSFNVVTVRDFLLRLNAISEEVKKSKFKYADERNEYINFLDNGVAACREAKKQGRPDDPKAVAQILRDRRKNIFVGNGQQTVLHTSAASEAPEGLLLPPIPNHPDITQEKRIIIP
jgi:hypothetical protein